ncbi:MAG: hypothetical protein MAG551_01452 [Candidatus Scalindua arabica]|uniref:AAA+ ATPase domain-containing protein n=1 Tax=Candidatus Scalindua arabica TaxID=1127984 RepID=A0A941W359_9BACT|nr:hypothetical protein [Candidatus Scalindua arabica]
MVKRKIVQILKDSIRKYPVVALLGARQVGKTTLAKVIKGQLKKPAIYLDLELTSDLNKLGEAQLFLSQYQDTLVIVDEIQRMPELFPLLRALVDQNRMPGRFLILGSTSIDLLKQSSESLAGRIKFLELSPFHLAEIGASNSQILWVRGGFPNSFLANNDTESNDWRESFISTYLERDVPQLGFRVPSLQLRRFWTMLAHNQGQLWNASQIANSLGVSAPTAKHYLNILGETFVIRELLPFFANVGKRLVKSPKIYFRDTGILHRLLNINSFEDLQSNPIIGNSWEGFVIEEILKILPGNFLPYFYRTSAGAEIDLVITKSNNVEVVIEAKYSLSPKLQKGFWHSIDDLKPKHKIVVYPGNETYPVKNGIIIMSIKDIPAWIRKRLSK